MQITKSTSKHPTNRSLVGAGAAMAALLMVLVAACGSSATSGVAAHATSTPTAAATPTPTALPTATPTPFPRTGGRLHEPIAACRLLDATQAAAIIGAPLGVDTVSSGTFGDYGNPQYLYDDCNYTIATGPSKVRIRIHEPAHAHGATLADGKATFAADKADLSAHHVTFSSLPGLGDDAIVVVYPDGVQAYALDGDIAFIAVSVDGSDVLDKAVALLLSALLRADSGQANGTPA
jgi:hypothetical protein